MYKILKQYIKEDLLNNFEKLTNKEAQSINKKILKHSSKLIIILKEDDPKLKNDDGFYSEFKVIKEGKKLKKFKKNKKDFLKHCLVIFIIQFNDVIKNIFNTYEYLPEFVTNPKCKK